MQRFYIQCTDGASTLFVTACAVYQKTVPGEVQFAAGPCLAMPPCAAGKQIRASRCGLLWRRRAVRLTVTAALSAPCSITRQEAALLTADRKASRCWSDSTAVQRQAAVTAHLKSEQLLLFAFVRQYRPCNIGGWDVIYNHPYTHHMMGGVYT